LTHELAQRFSQPGKFLLLEAAMTNEQVLESWNDGAARQAILDFVAAVTAEGPGFVSPEARVATFDNDGTLSPEKPMPIQAIFIVQRLAQMAEAQPELRDRQPWKGAYEQDFSWLADVMNAHYAGDDTNIPALAKGVIAAFAGVAVEDFEAQAEGFFRNGNHPTLGRPFTDCAYVPMVELLHLLEVNGFANYIASGGGRDFMRPVSQDVFGIPRERVIGSTAALSYTKDERGSTVTHAAGFDYLDDGPEKPIRIWSRVGRRPLVAAGNSNGDIPMLEFAANADKPSLRLLLLHDDAEREFAYTTGAEQALEQAKTDGWTVVSIKNDWATVF
jgi:phosphoserine phosphatase